MRKIKTSYFYRFWRRYGLIRQCVLLALCISIWIGLACSATRAESSGYKGRHMSLNNQMAELTEKLELTTDQQSRVRAILEEYQNKRRNWIWNRTGSRKEMRDKMTALHSEEENRLETILSDEQMDAFMAYRQERRAIFGRHVGNEGKTWVPIYQN